MGRCRLLHGLTVPPEPRQTGALVREVCGMPGRDGEPDGIRNAVHPMRKGLILNLILTLTLAPTLIGCEKGKATAGRGAACSACLKGQFAGAEGLALTLTPTLTLALTQNLNGTEGLLQCEACGRGTYATGEGRSVCATCIRNFYADSSGATICQECPANSVTLGTGAESFQQCLCTPPHRLTMRAGKCEACPAGASCEAGEAVKPKDGFWLPARDTPGKP